MSPILLIVLYVLLLYVFFGLSFFLFPSGSISVPCLIMSYPEYMPQPSPISFLNNQSRWLHLHFFSAKLFLKNPLKASALDEGKVKRVFLFVFVLYEFVLSSVRMGLIFRKKMCFHIALFILVCYTLQAQPDAVLRDWKSNVNPIQGLSSRDYGEKKKSLSSK